MNYIKITKRQLDTLKSLPNNLNDSTSNQCISGLIILGKLNIRRYLPKETYQCLKV